MGNGSCRRKSLSGYLKEPKKAAREKKSLLIISNLTNLGSFRPRDNKASSLEKTIMFPSSIFDLGKEPAGKESVPGGQGE